MKQLQVRTLSVSHVAPISRACDLTLMWREGPLHVILML